MANKNRRQSRAAQRWLRRWLKIRKASPETHRIGRLVTAALGVTKLVRPEGMDKHQAIIWVVQQLRAAGEKSPLPIKIPRQKSDKAGLEQKLKDFYWSFEWRKLRYTALKQRGARCECCGNSAQTGAVINVDHIKPIRYFWELRLDLSNLQILCNDCNHGKGSWDTTDWSKEARETQH